MLHTRVTCLFSLQVLLGGRQAAGVPPGLSERRRGLGGGRHEVQQGGAGEPGPRTQASSSTDG